MRNKVALLVWALILLIGAAAARVVPPAEPHGPLIVAGPKHALSVAEQFAKAQLESPLQGAESQRQLASARTLRLPPDFDSQRAARADVRLDAWVRPSAEPAVQEYVATIGPPEGASKLLTDAMMRPRTALAEIEAVSHSARMRPEGFSAYGELEPDIFGGHRLTILQLGDSHTAADLFTGRVRERLQQVFGNGGDAYIVPGKPHLGVRSALFECDASDGWSYEALQRPDAPTRRFYLTGFNAVAHHAGASLALRSRGGRYDRLEVSFLKQPGGGRAEVLVDGSPSGEIDLDGAADEPATLALRASEARASQGFHEISVKALTDAPVTVTSVDVGREGDGVSYISLGFPGATVQLLQKLNTENIAEDFRHMAPDIVVLAFGTNEGFNDNLDIGVYTEQYERIVRRLMDIRPGLRIVIIGPPDAARPANVCHAAGVGQECGSGQVFQVSASEGGGQCRFPTPPKLNLVREAQRRLAQRLGAEFWDWSSAMPGPCGAQIWAAANPPLMAHDYVHMTVEGYKQSADRFANFLIPLIEGRQTRTHVVSNN